MANTAGKKQAVGVLGCGLLFVLTTLSTFLYCDHASSSDFLLCALFCFVATPVCLVLLFGGISLLLLQSYANLSDDDRCAKIAGIINILCVVGIVVILVFLAVSLLWTIFVTVLFLPYGSRNLAPMLVWQLIFYLVLVADAVFLLVLKRATSRAVGPMVRL